MKTPNKKPEEANKTPKQEKAKTPNEKKAKPEQKTPKSPKDTPKKRTVEGGVVIEDLKQGEGQVAKPGKICQVLMMKVFVFVTLNLFICSFRCITKVV